MRLLLGAFGDPGHAFPMLALGARLVERGHVVAVQTWARWAADAERAGMAFLPAPEYHVFPTREAPLAPYAAAVRAARETRPQLEAFRPDRVVADVLTPAPALAAELADVPWATLVPHLFPWPPPGRPPFGLGARPARTRAGRAGWRATERLVARGLERGRREYDRCRAELGLGPCGGVHPALSRELTLVATLPQLEPPRAWPRWARVTGPLHWERPGAAAAPPPPGDAPLVLVAPSTAQDPEGALLRAALAGLARAPVRVLAVAGRGAEAVGPVPANARVVPWTAYAATMPACDLVVGHGGHGTLVRALTLGRPVLVCPAGGDMGENAARASWAGAGLRLPRRWLGPRTLRWAVEHALEAPALRREAERIAAWARTHDGADAAAEALEAWAR